MQRLWNFLGTTTSIVGLVLGVRAAGAAPPPGTLPIPCLGSACSGGRFGTSGFVSAGQATATQAGTKLTVNQTSNNATLNWQSFNIAANGTVQFVQPGATSVALNQINDASASQIFGTLTANGRVFLINQNGIIFGAGAQVSVGGLVASTLNIDPTAVSNGLIAPGSNGRPAFQAFADGTTGGVEIDNGAVLQTKSGGQILVFAPQIANQGSISTPGGQTILAAGDTIYLASSSDPSLRGLLVQIGGSGGTVTNGDAANATVAGANQVIGQIVAADGNITLAGYAVNQLGRVSATTSINENGSIRLQAGDHGNIGASGAPGVSGTLLSGTGGIAIAGPNSTTEVTLDATDPSTTVDSVPQLKSDINISGYTVQMLNGSVARATGGTIEVAAAKQATNEPLAPSTSDGSRVYVAPGAELDVSGASIALPVASNVIPVQLRGTELADSPLQQNGPLRSQTVYVDIRQGTPLADISGEVAAIGHNVLERNLAGGSISIQSHGDVIIAQGAQLDVAGGQIDFTGGYLNTSYLLTTQGQIVNIAQASPDLAYAGIANGTTIADPKWGVTKTYASIPPVYSPGYVEGKDAGSLSLSAPEFIFDGAVTAGTVAGLYQRAPGAYIPTGTAYQGPLPGIPDPGTYLYRPYNQVPQAASLTIGTPGSDFVVGNLGIASGLVLPGLTNADGTPFNPLTDPLPASVTTSTLRPQLLGATGFGNVSLYTDGKFFEPANVSLEFPGGGSFSATAGVIDVEGGIDIPGGTIALAAEPTALPQPTSGFVLTLGAQAALTARGEWVNDNPLLYPQGNAAPLFIDGGTISLTAQSAGTPVSPGLRLESGSVIDVSGGAQLTAAGALNAGVGGKISLGAETSVGAVGATPETIQIAATLSGYGLFDGGSLTLHASSICVAAADCAGGDPAQLWVSPSALAAGGFSAYTLTADNGGLTVAPGTTIDLRQTNMLLPTGYSMLPNEPSLIGRSALGLLPDQLRLPVNLTLNQSVPATEFSALGPPTLTVTADMPSLSVGTGALIQADPGAAITLNSNVRIEVDGTIDAPAGSISLGLGAALPESFYNPTQAIWLGQQGVLDVAGFAQIYPNKLGQPVGNVLDGGTVNITATRGYIELLPGSVIDVAGTAGVLDVIGPGGASARTEQVASAGGSVQLTAAEGVVLGGSLEAAAGVPGAGLPQPAGGSFTLTLDGSQRNDYALGYGGKETFSDDARQVIVSASQPPLVVGLGTAVPDSTAGYAYVSASALASAGFDSISLRAAPLPTQAGELPGLIDFQGNVDLSAGRLISLDSAGYAVSAASSATVHAPYVEFGNSNQYFPTLVPPATAGTGTLTVAGGFIELYGASALEGVGTAQFDSTGDLRLRGLLDLATSGATAFNGSLSMAGNLELQAQQIYPATLSQFVLSTDPASLTDPVAGSILVQSAATPATNPVPLSAGGSLTLSAGTVAQDGVLRAPFGAINIDAQSINLRAGSLTSTSADGLTIPFGTTQGGLAWVYPLQNNYNVIYGTGGVAPPAQLVTLQGAQVNVNKGAVIDVSGGGDLQAYEWISGTGGTNDVLANTTANGGRPNQFAILPSLSSNVAPYDPNISAGSTLQVGDAVYLSGTAGLAAGYYQLLPSRYALLPGAFLVSAVSGYQDIQPGQSYSVLGGGAIISGYDAVAGTSLGNSRTSGFEVVPAAVVLQQAQYTLTGANQFFSSQAAGAAAGAAGASGNSPVAVPRLPQDSGVLALVASDALTLDGTLKTEAAAGGLGAEVDVSSADILVGDGAASTQPGQILLTTASLDALGAQTLLLGGLRVNDAITTTAQSVEIAAGADLTAPQVLVTAQDQITVDGGAAVTASGSAPGARDYTLTGDGAFLSVSAGAQSTVTRGNTTGSAGVLTLAPGSSISAAGGSVYLEAANNVVTGGALDVNGADLAVQSPQILLGAAPAGITGTLLGASVLGAPGLRNLLLASGSAIDVYGSVTAAAQNITLDAPGFAGFGAASDAAVLSATTAVKLTNSRGATSVGGGTGQGSLTIAAPTITLTGGDLAATGFGSLALDAGQTFSASADGALSTTGNLSVSASQITTASNVSMNLAATGAVSLLAPAKPVAPGSAAPLGGSLSIAGSSIDLATQIVLPSGQVTLTTTGAGGDLTLASGAAINVAGVTQDYAGVDVATPGGAVSLTSAGNLTLGAGSAIDVSGGGQGGALALSAAAGTVAVDGTLRGTGAAGSGASFSIDAQQFGDFGALNRVLNAGSFAGGRSVRLRGVGDLVVASGSGNAVTAANVSLEADQGRIVVDGLIDASGGDGGTATLAASGDVVVNGTIDARATQAGQRGGAVQLETSQGAMLLNAGSSIDVRGGGTGEQGTGGGGSVLLRVPGATVTDILSGAGGVALNGSILGSSRTTLEGFAVYQNTTGAISSTDTLADPSNPIYANAAAFASNAPAITTALGQQNNGTFVVAPGVEIDATVPSNGTGALELDSDWNLYDWKFGPNAVAGVLTLRAQGSITFNASLSDGFAATSGTGAFTLPTQASDSWSYRIAAGADFSAANPLTVIAPNAANPADVTIAACLSGCTLSKSTRGQASSYTPNMVRTGDGFIEVSAADDFVLGSQASLLYTAGVAGDGIALPGRVGSLQGLAYPTGGGDIQITAGGNITGAVTDQFVNAWLWRVGSTAQNPQGSATAWTVDFQSFQQGVAALGGGNVAIRAGGDITDLSASIPTIGVPVGGTTFATSAVEVTGGGELAVTAGGSILGGSFYVGRGDAMLLAGGDVGADDVTAGGTGLAPIVGLGDAALNVTARGNLALAEIVNPTLLNRGAYQGAGIAPVYFSTYGPSSAVSLTAVGGTLTMNDDNVDVISAISSSFLGGNVINTGATTLAPLDMLPPTVNLYALSGDVSLGRTLALSPAATGNLQVFANQNVVTAPSSSGESAQLIVSDADPTQLPTAAAPQATLQIYKDIIQALAPDGALPDQHAATPVFAAPDLAGTLAPVRVVALNGSVEFQPEIGGITEGIWSAKPVDVFAGLDVVDLNMVAQNTGAGDVTSVTAGRDIIYPQTYLSTGQVAQDSNGIVVDGAGALQLTAGRNVDLGTSAGVSTRANLVNSVLPAIGAGISVNAGISGGTPQDAAFIAQYVTGSSQFDSNVIDFVQTLEGTTGLTAAEAKQRLGALSPQLQRTFVEQLFFDLLGIYGSKEAATGNGDYSGAFAAVSALFPGANPNLAQKQTNPYAGNIELYFSRIYTEQGGNISLSAPGGEINVGLATAPTAFGVNKAPDQLGIVAQTSGDVNAFAYNDFQVNQSRVFAADGGNILVWSTEGNIDAGRGAKTAISAPSLNIVYDDNGQPAVTLRAAIAGSGIQALAATPGVSPGNVDLFAPHGVVNANDAGIVAGNLTIAATAVLGSNNISVSGTSVGVPVAVTGLGASYAGATSTAAAASNTAESFAGANSASTNTPVADSAISWLEVFVTGLGEENCNASDTECLKREQLNRSK